MNALHSKSDSLSQRLRRHLREIYFALALTLMAVVYTFSSGHLIPEKAPIAFKGSPATLQ